MLSIMKHRVMKNASAILICKVIQAILSFVIGLFTARYLGPSNYGLITYAAAIVAFFLPIMQLGLSSILVQEFINRPDDEGKILGTSLVLNVVSAIVSVGGVTAFSFVANRDDPETVIVCFLYSLTLIFQATEMTQYWFQSKLLSKYPSIAALVAYGVVSVYKIYILTSAKDIRWFAVVHVIEAAIVAALLMIIYKKLGGKRFSFSLALGKELFAKSKYYISSGLMVVIYNHTDRIMLKMMVDEAETGYYSAAFTCVGITGIVFSAVMDSMRPHILSGKKESDDVFKNRITLLFSILAFMTMAQSIGMTLLAKPIVYILFGKDYIPTITILQILVWQTIFGYFGTARNIWILAEGKQSYLWKINLMGTIVNVIGNACLIPVLGARGAAIASVGTQMFADVLLCFIIKPMRPVGAIMFRSFNPNIVLKKIKGVRKQDENK